MKNKKNIVILFVCLAVLIFGATFAYLQWASSNVQKTVVTFTANNDFSCSADGGGNITSNDYKLVPSLCTNENYAIKRTVTINTTVDTNSLTYKPISLNMWLKVNSISSGLANTTNFKYALTRNDSSCTSGVIASGNFNDSSSGTQKQLLTNLYFLDTASTTYYLWIWLDAAEEEDLTMDQVFNISLGGTCEKLSSVAPTFISQGAVSDDTSSTYVESENGIDFLEDASDTNGKGVYLYSATEDDPIPIYYYRGDVDDNNVYFANYCWKMVRTTETGGLKLVYNGFPTSESTCDNNYLAAEPEPLDPGGGETKSLSFKNNNVKNNIFRISNSQFDSEIHGSHFNEKNRGVRYMQPYYIDDNIDHFEDSVIKDAIDRWYLENLVDYSSYLEDTVWCNDISPAPGEEVGSGSSEGKLQKFDFSKPVVASQLVKEDLDCGGAFAYVSSYRLENGTPSLTCSNRESAYTVSDTIGNGLLNYPIGLLTIDEAMLAGVSSYLQNGDAWWLMSPISENSCDAYNAIFPAITVDNFGIKTRNLEDTIWANTYRTVDEVYFVRPAISLAPGYNFAYGDGSGEDPYRFDETVTPGPESSEPFFPSLDPGGGDIK